MPLVPLRQSAIETHGPEQSRMKPLGQARLWRRRLPSAPRHRFPRACLLARAGASVPRPMRTDTRRSLLSANIGTRSASTCAYGLIGLPLLRASGAGSGFGSVVLLLPRTSPCSLVHALPPPLALSPRGCSVHRNRSRPVAGAVPLGRRFPKARATVRKARFGSGALVISGVYCLRCLPIAAGASGSMFVDLSRHSLR